MKQIFCHLFLPRISNNQRAKLLHHSSILFFAVFFFLGQFFLSLLKTDYPALLGDSIDISTEQLLNLTNRDRQQQHLSALKIDSTLAQAASLKADYMFQKNFWAHNGPDGITPWYFFKKVGYTYIYAGENLARGFTDSGEVITAWMNSPTHRENMLSPNYTDVGFAIKKGKLLGEDTTLVVEMFGSKDIAFLEKSSDIANASIKKIDVLPAATATASDSFSTQLQDLASSSYASALKTTSLISARMVTLGVGFFVLFAFIFVLVLDVLIIERKKIARVVGHNADHVLFFGAILTIMIITLRGLIL